MMSRLVKPSSAQAGTVPDDTASLRTDKCAPHYNVNPDGTGKATCAFSVFGTSTLDIVLRMTVRNSIST
jgi:hypothetical protein